MTPDFFQKTKSTPLSSFNSSLLCSFSGSPSSPISYVRLIDDESLEIIDSYKLGVNEGVASLVSCKFAEDGPEYYVVGVAEVLVEEDEPSIGRILIFEVVNRKLVLVTALKVRGAVYSLQAFHGGLLAGINSTLLFLTLNAARDDAKLTIECGYHSHVMLLFIRTQGDFILAGDLLMSLSLYRFKESGFQKSLELLAADDNPGWLTACELLDLDTYLGAQGCYNLFMCQVGQEKRAWWKKRAEVGWQAQQ